MIIHKSWYGTDTNQKTSLFEYGLLVQKQLDGNFLVINLVNSHDYNENDSSSLNDLYFIKTITNLQELKNISNENWFDKKGV